jgi:FMN-dependent NADH-azoreductase
LAGGRKLIIASARGGFYGSDTGQAWLDHQETYLRGFFGFLGVTDIAFVRAEGIAMGPDARAKALEDAKIQATAIAA